jgi:hypothetical protein
VKLPGISVGANRAALIVIALDCVMFRAGESGVLIYYIRRLMGGIPGASLARLPI